MTALAPMMRDLQPDELPKLRPTHPPRRRGAIEVKPDPALSAGVVRHRKPRGGYPQPRLEVDAWLVGLGRHRKPLSWLEIFSASMPGQGVPT